MHHKNPMLLESDEILASDISFINTPSCSEFPNNYDDEPLAECSSILDYDPFTSSLPLTKSLKQKV